MSILKRILERSRERVERQRKEVPPGAIRSAAESAPPRPSFRDAIGQPGTSLIAEAKHRSPSKGVLREPYDPVSLAREYEAAGARAVSILTEPDFFGGSSAHLSEVAGATTIPLLRKDFLVDPYQCWQAKAWGASAALLIVAALEDGLLRDLHSLLCEMNLDPLVEVHTEREAERALALEAHILGVNNRDLTSFETDRATTARIARLVPAGSTLLISESGISRREHVLEVEAAGASGILVGEALVTSANPGDRVRELVAGPPEEDRV